MAPLKFLGKDKFCYLLLFLIVLSAIFLRFYQLGERFGFDWDQERDAFVAWDIIRNHHLVFLGPKVGPSDFFLGPFYNYLTLPFYFFFRMNPIGAAFGASLIGVLTVVVIFFVARSAFSVKVAIIASSFWTFSVFLVSSDRTAWNVNPFSLFLLIFLYLLLKFKDGKQFYLVILGGVFGLLIQLHFSAVFLLPIFLIFFLIFKPKLKFKYSTFAILTFLLVNLPFILFEIKNGFLNSKIIISFLLTSPPNPNSLSYLDNFTRAWKIFLEFSTNLIYPSSNFALTAFLKSLVLVLLLTVFWIFLKYKDKTLLFLLLWVIFPVFGYILYRSDIFPPYYFMISAPAILLLFSYLAVKIFERNLFGKFLVTALLVFFFVANSIFFLTLKSDIGFSNKMRAVKFIVDRVGDRPLFVSYSTQLGYNKGYDYLLKYYGKESKDVPEVYHFSIVYPKERESGSREWVFGGIKVIQRSEGLGD